MKTHLSFLAGFSALALVGGSLLLGPSAEQTPTVLPEGPIPSTNTIWNGIESSSCGSLTIFRQLALVGGWAERLNTSSLGQPRYTVFAPVDAVLESTLESLNIDLNNIENNPSLVASLLADHIANGSFDPVEFEDQGLPRITMRSGFVAGISTTDDSTPRVLYSNVLIAGAFITSGNEYDSGWLYCVNGFINSSPQTAHEGLNAPDAPADGGQDSFTVSWTSPPSPTSSRYHLFELTFSGVVGVMTQLSPTDFENLGTQPNCVMNPISRNTQMPTLKYFLIVSCSGSGTVHPRLSATSLTIRNNTGSDSVVAINDSSGASVIDMVNGNVLTITKTGSGQGAVTSNISGINCGPLCSGVFTSRTRITLTPQPNPGSVFAGWSGACSGSIRCRINLSSSTTVTARFELGTEVKVIGVAQGSGVVSSRPIGVNCSASAGSTCSATVGSDRQVSLQARANRGSRFVGWLGACVGTSPCLIPAQQAGQTVHIFPIFEPAR